MTRLRTALVAKRPNRARPAPRHPFRAEATSSAQGAGPFVRAGCSSRLLCAASRHLLNGRQWQAFDGEAASGVAGRTALIISRCGSASGAEPRLPLSLPAARIPVRACEVTCESMCARTCAKELQAAGEARMS
eukprot:5874643-Pleurochrysis_carterae.AAC.1